MRTVKAAAVQLSPVLYSREGTVDKIVRKIHELGREGVRFATFPETVVPYPLMKEIAKTVPDAASYGPITILVDERADGVHLSYDSMASLIAPYGSEPALAVARELDLKIVSLLEAAAR